MINSGRTVFSAEGIHFRQTSDISATNWTPIGTASNQFRGNYNGNGRRINLTMNRASAEGNGVFGFVWGGTIRNLIVDANVTGRNATGAIVGQLAGFSNDWRGVVMNCVVYGTVTGTERTGGIVGDLRVWGDVRNSYSMATVTGTSGVGGIAGYIHNTTSGTNAWIEFCYATGAINGSTLVGGVIGVNSGIARNSVALNSSITVESSDLWDIGR